MKRVTAALVIIAFFSGKAGAQNDYTFKVLVNKGRNEVRSGSGWQQVKVGSSLKPNDELKVAENSYLGLMHVTGKPLELKQAGNYKVADLAARIKGGSSVLNKYTDFILSENSERKNNLMATGAVHRGIGIKVFLPKPESAVVFGNVVAINWDTEKVKGPYSVRLKNIFGEELVVMEAKEGPVGIDLYDQKLRNEDNIIVEVVPKNGDSGTPGYYILKKLSSADQMRVKNALKEIEASLEEPTAINQLMLAGFYENNKLLVDAATAYLNAVNLAPDVPAYKEAYESFLARNEMKGPE